MDRSKSSSSPGTSAAGLGTAEAVGLRPYRHLAPPPVDLDQWEFDPELDELAAVASAVSAQAISPGASPKSPPAEPFSLGSLPAGAVAPPIPEMPAEAALRAAGRGTVAWAMLLVGLMGFVCGGVLLGWSFVAQQQHLWDIGLPLTLVGQAGLLVGLALQLERLWHNSRSASSRLEQVDEHLHELKHTTTLIGGTRSASSAFYCHMAEGASPQLLLADLKGQLDLLAVKLAQSRRSS